MSSTDTKMQNSLDITGGVSNGRGCNLQRGLIVKGTSAAYYVVTGGVTRTNRGATMVQVAYAPSISAKEPWAKENAQFELQMINSNNLYQLTEAQLDLWKVYDCEHSARHVAS